MSADCCQTPTRDQLQSRSYRRVLGIALGINLAMLLVEAISGLKAGSVSLQADALDFLGDTANYGISLFVAGMAVGRRAKAAMAKGISMGVLGVWVLAAALWRALHGLPPNAVIMGIVGVAALAANAICFVLLSRYRSGDSNMRSVWLCSRNDVIGNLAVLASAIGVAARGSAWPDLTVAIVMALLTVQAAGSVVRQAAAELHGADT